YSCRTVAVAGYAGHEYQLFMAIYQHRYLAAAIAAGRADSHPAVVSAGIYAGSAAGTGANLNADATGAGSNRYYCCAGVSLCQPYAGRPHASGWALSAADDALHPRADDRLRTAVVVWPVGLAGGAGAGDS